jgi:branched-chain amino acid transport system substrate-binding protein
MHVKRALPLAAAAIAVVAVVLFVVGIQYKSSGGSRIGAVLPLTGDLAKFGAAFQMGIALAVERNGSGVSVVYDDDGGDPSRGITAFSRLIDAEGVPAVIGGTTSPVAMALSPIADRRNVVLISPAATAPALSQFKYFFRVMPSDSYEGSLMAQFASTRLNKPQIAMVYVNNDWGQGLMSVFVGAYRAAGGPVTGTFPFQPGQTDFRVLVSQLKASNATYIYLLGYLKELTAFLTQATELGLDRKYLGAFSMNDPDLLSRIPKTTLEGSFVTVPDYDPANPRSDVAREFAAAFAKRYGQAPDQFAAHAYDCAGVTLDAIRSGARTGSQIRGYLDGRTFDGATGTFTFKGADVQKPYRILEYREGRFAGGDHAAL